VTHSGLLLLRRLGLLSLTTFAVSSVGVAQGINVDFQDARTPVPVPASTYAAAGSAGVWNGVSLPPGVATPLVDKSGAATAATVTVDPSLSLDLWFDNVNMAGDDAALLEDILHGGSAGAVYPITFNGVTPGTYDVVTYAIAPDDKLGHVTDVDVPGAPEGVQAVGGAPFTGVHVQGVSFARHTVTTSGTIEVLVAFNAGNISVNGIQLEPVDNTSSDGCDCTGGNAPCGHISGEGRGCPNSNPNGLGARLTASGLAVVANDSFALSVIDAAPNKPGLILAGTQSLGPVGVGIVPNTPGVLCVGGVTRRGAVVLTDAAGSASFPDFQGAPYGQSDIVALGTQISYTHWFRDPGTAAGCPNDTASSDFNFSNGWTVTWQ